MLLNGLIIFIASLYSLSCESEQAIKAPKECIEFGVPPFSGTIFIDPNIITKNDPSTFTSLNYNGQEIRTMYDRRDGGAWLDLKPYLFPAKYDDGLIIEIQVNPEFGSIKIAQAEAEKYAPIIGRLTTELRKDIETVWIHKGLEPFGGGNKNILIHTDWSLKHYENQGILEETLLHEASHTSLDSYHSNNIDWLAAQSDDCKFISQYAEKNPLREDIAETYLTYYVIKYRPERISSDLKKIIEDAIPNRIKYFDKQNFNMHPIR